VVFVTLTVAFVTRTVLWSPHCRVRHPKFVLALKRALVWRVWRPSSFSGVASPVRYLDNTARSAAYLQ
jgi:hypothetical protein